MTQRTCDDEGSLEGAPEGGGGEVEEGAESLCHQMRARLRSFEEYFSATPNPKSKPNPNPNPNPYPYPYPYPDPDPYP